MQQERGGGTPAEVLWLPHYSGPQKYLPSHCDSGRWCHWKNAGEVESLRGHSPSNCGCACGPLAHVCPPCESSQLPAYVHLNLHSVSENSCTCSNPALSQTNWRLMSLACSPQKGIIKDKSFKISSQDPPSGSSGLRANTIVPLRQVNCNQEWYADTLYCTNPVRPLHVTTFCLPYW